MPEHVPCPHCSAQVPAGARFCQKCGRSVEKGAKESHHGPKPKKAPRGQSQFMIFAAGAVAVILLVWLGIGTVSRMNKSADHDAATSAPTAAMAIEGAGPIPDWLASAGKQMIADYTWAASHHDDLQYFPCFCGCYQSAGHVSNSECYYKRGAGNQITAYDSHAYG